ncbi:MAG TPA: winged helix-turn-helix domain-containing protein [Terriglobales bacterium]|nr:winged helix-turn-helix domain-containing protein [Terriglobales bacterium]
MAAPARHSVIRFATFEVDLVAGEVRKSGMRQKLAGQPFEVLRVLLERPQEIITRDELRQRVWSKDTFVDYDVGLRRAITRLRDVLGDSADNPRFIETIPRRGYRFIAPLDQNDGVAVLAVVSAAKPTVGFRRWPRSLQLTVSFGLGLAVMCLIVLGLARGKMRWSSSMVTTAPHIHSIAVLPLQNLSADLNGEYLSDGVTDALITDLAQMKGLKVISRTSSMQYKGSKKSLRQIADELGVDGILEGTVHRSGNRFRITAQLIYAPADDALWAGSYDRDISDLLSVTGDVTREIAIQIQREVASQKQGGQRPFRHTDAAALDAYLRGNYHLNRYGNGGGDEEKRAAAEYFQKAISADPEFAPAYNGLAKANFDLFWPSADSADLARTAAQRAVALDPDFSDAHTTLGWINECAWNYAASEEEFRRAIALNPNDAQAHEYLGVLLDDTGRFEEGWRERQVAQELDPNHDHLSNALMIRGKYDQAIAAVQMFLKRYPDDGYLHWTLFKDYEQTRHFPEAARELERAWALYGHPQIASQVHHAYAVGGYRAAIRVLAEALERSMNAKQAFLPGNIAEFYTSLGEKERAMHWLELAYTQHRVQMAATDLQLQYLDVEFRVDPLRSDPRFQDLIRHIGLPEVKIEESANERRTTVIAR